MQHIAIPDERQVFITETDAVVGGTDVESRGGQLLDAGDRIELPSPASVAGEVFWIVPPLPSRRWLQT